MMFAENSSGGTSAIVSDSVHPNPTNEDSVCSISRQIERNWVEWKMHLPQKSAVICVVNSAFFPSF